MKAIDVGCGYELDRQLPGADLCNNNLGVDEVELEPGQSFFPNFLSTEDPIPVPDGTYDLIWYSYGLYVCDLDQWQSIATELSRIAKPRATLILRDYTQWWDYIKSEDNVVTVSLDEWIAKVREVFKDWNEDGHYVSCGTEGPEKYDDGALCVVVILTKGWG